MKQNPWRIVRIVAWINLAAFMVAQFTVGDALTGKTEFGHFYLNNLGRLTEVSQATFTAAKYWAWATMLSVVFLLWRPPAAPKI